MRLNNDKTPSEDVSVDAVVWFSYLLSCRDKSLFAQAAEAEQALKKLGIQIKFRWLYCKHRRGQQGAHHD